MLGRAGAASESTAYKYGVQARWQLAVLLLQEPLAVLFDQVLDLGDVVGSGPEKSGGPVDGGNDKPELDLDG